MATETFNRIAIPNFRLQLVDYVNRKVKDKALSEDIVQDVFIKAHARLGQLRDAEKVTSWIYSITRNAIADHFRPKPKSPQTLDLNWESEVHEFNECVARWLNKLMSTLPEKYRIPLELTEIQGLSQTEIAKRLNISYSGTKSRVQRARVMLREKMNELFIIEADAYGNIIVCEDRANHCNSCP